MQIHHSSSMFFYTKLSISNSQLTYIKIKEFQALLKTMHSMWDEKITPKVIAKFAEHQMVIMSPAHINKYLSSLPKHPKEFYQLFSIRGQGKGTGENTAKSVCLFISLFLLFSSSLHSRSWIGV